MPFPIKRSCRGAKLRGDGPVIVTGTRWGGFEDRGVQVDPARLDLEFPHAKRGRGVRAGREGAQPLAASRFFKAASARPGSGSQGILRSSF
jgi:hypothetical protein